MRKAVAPPATPSLVVNPESERGLLARYGGYLLLTGGVLGLLSVAVPHSEYLDPLGVVSVSAASVAVGVFALWRGQRISLREAHGLILASSAVVTGSVYFTGVSPSPNVLFYIWSSLFVFYFFPIRQAALYVGFTAVSYGAALTQIELLFPPVATWLVVVGTVVVAGFFVYSLKARLNAVISGLSTAASTDSLTGLPNRRALLDELGRTLASEESATLALADLNGFKRYNDTFGHPAGDALLRHLAAKLRAACEGGMAARLGGDEFCALLSGHRNGHQLRRLLEEALREEGEGFRITAAVGSVTLPTEAASSSEALRLADVRMYSTKVAERAPVEDIVSQALTRTLEECHPGLEHHVEEVEALATATGELLGLRGEELERMQRAARLHDLGKVALPTAILTKGTALDEEEWAFMREHSLIGERILRVVPSFKHVAAIVRASHERWDGTGYPDRLAGDEIPLPARIIAVADAFCAMVEDRPYAAARTPESAVEELRRCMGTQFDPRVVSAFIAALSQQEARPAASSPSASGWTDGDRVAIEHLASRQHAT